jgi:hypothetical protein
MIWRECRTYSAQSEAGVRPWPYSNPTSRYPWPGVAGPMPYEVVPIGGESRSHCQYALPENSPVVGFE